ncbi:hypothetical protein DL93DRAFT_2165911 [Clavulina sp. PMI_390]|nr:hypothetical protein DL93DRAFT_2165911 [Clavulina sp. PMI_390]
MSLTAAGMSSETVIRQVTQGVWIFSRPFARYNVVPIGGRSTAIKLATGDVWVLASTPLTPETKETIDAMGPVKWIMAADVVHHLFIDEFKANYPEAKVIGVSGLEAKKQFKFDGLYGVDPADTKYGFEPEIQACYFSGFKNRDVAFFHAPSKTLIEADLMMNLPPTEQYSKTNSTGKLPFVGDFISPWTNLQKRFLWSLGLDKEAMKRDAKTVAGWDFTRVIPCHGNVIEEKGKEAWREAYKWYLESNTTHTLSHLGFNDSVSSSPLWKAAAILSIGFIEGAHSFSGHILRVEPPKARSDF